MLDDSHVGGAFAPVGVQYLREAMLTAPAHADRLAAAITWLASADSAKVADIVLASDAGWSAI